MLRQRADRVVDCPPARHVPVFDGRGQSPDEWRWFVHGKPRGQARPRVTVAKGRPLVYSPQNTAAQQLRADIRECVLRDVWRESQKEGAWEVRLRFAMLLPKSRGKRRPGDSHAQKPDIDNLVKLVMDALTSTRMLWYDDCQVAQLSCSKEWVERGEDEGVSIALRRVQ